MKSLRSFLRAPMTSKVMALEAALLLLVARLLVLYVPLRHWRRRLTTAEPASSPEPLPFLAWRIARIIRRTAAWVPFKAVCLPQAMAGQWMLRWRRIPSRLTFGARQQPDETAETGLQFHAWLSVGGKCILGGQELGTYTALPPFDEMGLDASAS